MFESLTFKYKSRVYVLNLKNRRVRTEHYNSTVDIPENITIPNIPNSLDEYKKLYYELESPSEKHSELQNFLENIDWVSEDIYTDIYFLIFDLISHCKTKESIKERIDQMLNSY